MSQKNTVAYTLAQGLKRHGVEVLFSQSLPSALLLAAEDLGIRQFSYRTENAGTIMADAYARITHKIGVVTAQNGPAATLLVPGLAEAMKASIPLVALVQEVNMTQVDKNAFQEFDHIALFKSCTKWSRTLNDPDRALDYLDMAIAAAVSGRPGPVALMLPADVLSMTCEARTPRTQNLGFFPLDRYTPSPASIDQAADLLATAANPLVVVGGGVHLSDACAEVAALQYEANLPVVTTVMGKGAIDERNPLSIGVAGYAMGKLAPGRYMKSLFEEADVILLVGTKTNQNGTDSWTLYPKNATYIHIDVDGSEIGRNYEALRLVGDAKLALQGLIEKLRGRRSKNPNLEQRIADARTSHKADLDKAMAHAEANNTLRPEKMMQELQAFLTPESIVVSDASYSSLWTSCYLRSEKSGTRFITPRGLAGLGWGFPFGLGAKLARPTAAVFAVVGDGGFAHMWAELETSVRTSTPVVLTVLNNGILGYQKHAENAKFGRHTTACYFAPVDHAAMAQACGVRGVRVENVLQYRIALGEAVRSGQTTLIDAIIDPAAFPPVTLFDSLESGE
ncbi:acetolactate synthase catalytic subunit [Agrobacterium sp. 13-626]|nr:acetolactate synthase catalytic subunit [Agrobacterium sp. 13-626]